MRGFWHEFFHCEHHKEKNRPYANTANNVPSQLIDQPLSREAAKMIEAETEARAVLISGKGHRGKAPGYS